MGDVDSLSFQSLLREREGEVRRLQEELRLSQEESRRLRAGVCCAQEGLRLALHVIRDSQSVVECRIRIQREVEHNFERLERGSLDEVRDLRMLVDGFGSSLLDKLVDSESKYGWRGKWRDKGWREELCRELREHVGKGDPRDVAAFCAFAWYHGWSL